MPPRKPKILAIIPARSGSKRLKNKNILSLVGEPLIAWSIEAALKVPEIDDVIVSTNSPKIAAIAQKFGAEVPYLRPKWLASDSAKSQDVILELLQSLEKMGRRYDIIVLLQPTSPLRVASDIKGALQTFRRKKAHSVISVCECEHSPLWTNTLNSNQSMNNFLPRSSQRRSQELEQYYRVNGAVYVCDVKYFMKYQTFFLKRDSYAYIMPRSRSLDIDTKEDFTLAEFYLGKK